MINQVQICVSYLLNISQKNWSMLCQFLWQTYYDFTHCYSTVEHLSPKTIEEQKITETSLWNNHSFWTWVPEHCSSVFLSSSAFHRGFCWVVDRLAYIDKGWMELQMLSLAFPFQLGSRSLNFFSFLFPSSLNWINILLGSCWEG